MTSFQTMVAGDWLCGMCPPCGPGASYPPTDPSSHCLHCPVALFPHRPEEPSFLLPIIPSSHCPTVPLSHHPVTHLCHIPSHIAPCPFAPLFLSPVTPIQSSQSPIIPWSHCLIIPSADCSILPWWQCPIPPALIIQPSPPPFSLHHDHRPSCHRPVSPLSSHFPSSHPIIPSPHRPIRASSHCPIIPLSCLPFPQSPHCPMSCLPTLLPCMGPKSQSVLCSRPFAPSSHCLMAPSSHYAVVLFRHHSLIPSYCHPATSGPHHSKAPSAIRPLAVLSSQHPTDPSTCRRRPVIKCPCHTVAPSPHSPSHHPLCPLPIILTSHRPVILLFKAPSTHYLITPSPPPLIAPSPHPPIGPSAPSPTSYGHHRLTESSSGHTVLPTPSFHCPNVPSPHPPIVLPCVLLPVLLGAGRGHSVRHTHTPKLQMPLNTPPFRVSNPLGNRFLVIMIWLQFLRRSRAQVSGPRPLTARCRTPSWLKMPEAKALHSRSARRAAERPGLCGL